VGLIFAPDIFPGVLAASAALAAAVWAGHLLVFVRIGSVIRALEAGILGEAAGLGLEAEAVAALSAKLRELADELAELEDHFKNGKTQCTILEHDCDRAGEALKKIQENQRVVHGAIRDMQNRLGLEDVSQLKGRLAEKRTLQDEENTLKVLLKERLPSAWSGDAEAASEEGAETALMARVEQQLLRDVARAASLRQEEPGFQDGLSFGTGPASEAELSSLKEKRVQLNDQLEQIRHDLQQYRSSLAGFQEAINGILERYEERVYVLSLPDLKAGCDRLEEWTTQVLRQRENALAAHAILDEIEQDEEKKVAELFGEGSVVSAFFKNVTQGTYTQVFYDPESMKIRAQRMDGKSVSAEQLSGGAYDQLYFSIRMALASRLLPDEKAFFLLDDPFVKSDTGRLTKQLHMLLELSRQGWQVLYFSAKDEVKEILKPALKKGDITQQPVPTVIFKGLPKSSDSPVPEEHRKRDI
jgi:hypothetical protein